jgi:hypothetical protein
LEEAAYYEWFAERYGWTYDQTNSNPDRMIPLFVTVAGVRREIEQDAQRESEAASKREREMGKGW